MTRGILDKNQKSPKFESNVILEDEYWKLHNLGKPELRETSVLGFANPLPEAFITSPTIYPSGNHHLPPHQQEKVTNMEKTLDETQNTHDQC